MASGAPSFLRVTNDPSLNDRLLFAVPKKGRLQQPCLDLLHGSDIQFRRDNRLDIALVKNHPIALIFLPAADIPTFVGEGRVDLGITGLDQVREHEEGTPSTETTGVEIVMDLGFGKCSLCVQVPKDGAIQSPEQLVGKNIVTSFTQLTKGYFGRLEAAAGGGSVNAGSLKNKDTVTPIKYVGGSVEAACALGVADGIVDLVESGETMRAAGLKSIATVLESSAVLIKSKHPSSSTSATIVNLIGSRIRGVITAQRFVLCQYNVRRDRLELACKVTPGKRAPTITGLEEKDWVAVSAMVPRVQIASVMDRLSEEDIAAEDILVLKIDNSRTAA